MVRKPLVPEETVGSGAGCGSVACYREHVHGRSASALDEHVVPILDPNTAYPMKRDVAVTVSFPFTAIFIEDKIAPAAVVPGAMHLDLIVIRVTRGVEVLVINVMTGTITVGIRGGRLGGARSIDATRLDAGNLACLILTERLRR